jgi:hypothetical protein
VANELKKLSQELRRLRGAIPKILNTALLTVSSEMVERIHTKGLDSKGGKIGQYSTKPISISRKNQPRSTGRTFFSDGYKGFKSAVGMDSSKVTLELTSQLRQDLGVIPINKRSAGIGFKNVANHNKAKWAEDKYNKVIYDNTKKEINTLEKVFEFETNRILKTR